MRSIWLHDFTVYFENPWLKVACYNLCFLPISCTVSSRFLDWKVSPSVFVKSSSSFRYTTLGKDKTWEKNFIIQAIFKLFELLLYCIGILYTVFIKRSDRVQAKIDCLWRNRWGNPWILWFKKSHTDTVMNCWLLSSNNYDKFITAGKVSFLDTYFKKWFWAGISTVTSLGKDYFSSKMGFISQLTPQAYMQIHFTLCMPVQQWMQ